MPNEARRTPEIARFELYRTRDEAGTRIKDTVEALTKMRDKKATQENAEKGQLDLQGLIDRLAELHAVIKSSRDVAELEDLYEVLDALS
jgi:hypothetical protein